MACKASFLMSYYTVKLYIHVTTRSVLTQNFAFYRLAPPTSLQPLEGDYTFCITYENFRKSYRIAAEKISIYSS